MDDYLLDSIGNEYGAQAAKWHRPYSVAGNRAQAGDQHWILGFSHLYLKRYLDGLLNSCFCEGITHTFLRAVVTET